ncbi:cysteine hydrolase family protein [Neomegalonema perideroedes]|uniref:cysteine hydrolase family protein n=1 Tax=Neomegalonema perideroedes TaxID=217219 RepID=UPI00038164A7|nr:cysteine hydrolase family protein [Neomegalonema perideroedes]
MGDRALIVIDVQNDYFPGGKFTLSGMEAAAANAARVLEAARAAGDLVLHVRHEFASEDAPFFTPASEGARIHPSAAPREGEPVILKHAVNSFQGTDLKARLDAAGIKSVVIVGAMSHMCVEGAARAAADFGYAVTVVHDAVATRDLEFGGVVVPAAQAHATALAAIGFAYAATPSTKEWLSQREKAEA